MQEACATDTEALGACGGVHNDGGRRHTAFRLDIGDGHRWVVAKGTWTAARGESCGRFAERLRFSCSSMPA
jgi:hypothetical protein